MHAKLDEKVIQTIKSAARRAFQAEAACDYCGASARVVETTFGWRRHAVQRGLHEQETGKIIPNLKRTGRPCFLQQLLNLQADIQSLVDPNSQTHPTFENTFRYTRMTAKTVIEVRIRGKGYAKDGLPAESRMREILNRLNYRRRCVQKTKSKKIPETDAIFGNVKAAHARSDNDPDVLWRCPSFFLLADSPLSGFVEQVAAYPFTHLKPLIWSNRQYFCFHTSGLFRCFSCLFS